VIIKRPSLSIWEKSIQKNKAENGQRRRKEKSHETTFVGLTPIEGVRDEGAPRKGRGFQRTPGEEDQHR